MALYTAKSAEFAKLRQQKALGKHLRSSAVCDFQSIPKMVQQSDFVYFDPPYHPLSPTSSFTSYMKYYPRIAPAIRVCDVNWRNG